MQEKQGYNSLMESPRARSIPPMASTFIPFNKPYLTGQELNYIAEAHGRLQLAGDGHFTTKCSQWLENTTKSNKALITHSCTAALEMCAILIDIQPGDEVILPSYTFVSTANAFALRGAQIVFADIDPSTLNITPEEVTRLVTPKTKAVVIVHYAGVSCEIDKISTICKHNKIFLIEDAAQAILAFNGDRHLGSIGDFGCLSFHETKNIISGEGGALLINNSDFIEKAEIIREKGTNRTKFFRGEVDKYSWVELGSSFLPGEITAAFLWAQLEKATAIIDQRVSIWNQYNELLAEQCEKLGIKTPTLPDQCRHNAHIYYLVLPSLNSRSEFIQRMKSLNIHCVFHYVPLHDSEFTRLKGYAKTRLPVTEEISERLVRLPLWNGMDKSHVERVSSCALDVIREVNSLQALD